MEPAEEAVVTTPTTKVTREMAGEAMSEADATPQEPPLTSGLN